MTIPAMTALLEPVEELEPKVQMEELHPVSLNTITVNGKVIQRLAQADLNIKIAALAIVAYLILTIQTGEIIGLLLIQDQEVLLVVVLQADHQVGVHVPVVEVVAEGAGIKIVSFTNS